ncbi:MAG TPA: hypothetical protein VLW53_16590, partial [Candidatus Eisenbacteria bacterium]|nr:hypothetical protein [Candidatus Eisenbacteria bacterium]
MLALSRDPEKAARYAADDDLGRGLDLALSLVPHHRLESVLRNTGLVIFTPAALVAGRVEQGLEVLEGGGFRPVFARLLLFDEALVRRVWRYQLDTFRHDRWLLILDLLEAGPSLLLLVRGPAGAGGTGTTADRLKELKGPSDPALARPGQLRHEMGGMNKVINLVHSAEEWSDVVRETAILLPGPDQRAGWLAASRPGPGYFDRERWLAACRVGERWAGVSFVHTCV